MVDEREDRDYQEEGEYHFSEDQINDDIEGESSKTAPLTPGSSLLSKITPRMRAIIAGVVFIILMSVVLKMLVPTQTPSTEFAQTSPPAAPQTVVVREKPKTSPPLSTPPVSAAALAPKDTVIANQGNELLPPIAEPQMPTVPAKTETPITQAPVPPTLPQAPVPPLRPVATTKPLETEAASPPPPVVIVNAPLSAPQTPPMVETPSEPPISDTGTPNVTQRLAALEQQNTSMMHLLQSEYAQKLAEHEAAEIALRTKLDELNKKVTHLEAGINQITQLLQNVNKPLSSVSAPEANFRAREPRITYTVQAIIPGRAWLKSESGDTITVAEGDMLRNYGRIAKIDPYDGIVNIDTGNKMITLSYGNVD